MIGPQQRAMRGSDATDARSQFAGVVETLLSLAVGGSLDESLRAMVRAAIGLVGAEHGAVGVRGRGPELYEFVVEGITPDAVDRFGEPPGGRGIIGAVIERSAPLRIDDIAKHPRPTGFPPMRTFLGVSVRVRGAAVGGLYVTEKSGGRPFTDADERVIQALADAAGTVITRARLADAQRTRQSWIDATRDVTAALLTGTDTAGVLPLIADKSRHLAVAAAALIAVPTAEAADLTAVAVSGAWPDGIVGRRWPIDGTALGRAFQDGRTRRFDRFIGLAPAEVGPAILAPMQTKEAIAGVIVVTRETGDQPFSVEHADLLSSFADQVALAMRSATARRRMREANVMSDRDRIEADMHDHVIARLLAVGLNLQGAIAREESPDVRRRLSDTVDDLHQVVGEIRTTIFDVHDSRSGARGLRERLDQAVAAFAVAPMRTEISVSGPLSVVGAALADHAEAVVREGSSNAVRHSGGAVVTVTVRVDHSLTIEVCDDGVGISEGRPRSGLANLAARATEVGGTFEVSRRESGGTRLVWSAPLVREILP